MWTKDTFEKLIRSQPEPLQSRFQITHGMLLSVLSRPDGFSAMKQLILDSHGAAHTKKQLRKTAFELFRSLLDRKIVEYNWTADSRYPGLRVPSDLQEDFSLHQTLALYLVDTIALLDHQSPTYALDVLTLVESILESPDLILRKQLDALKTIKMQEMKAEGIEYDERIAELEKMEHPKPLRDFIYDTFNKFREAHPWVGQENIRPKSIAREMWENYHSFADYIREYDLHRAEGILLRYLSEAYKVLEQTVPEQEKNEELREMSVYFSNMVRGVDSSLLEDWEKMRAGGQQWMAALRGEEVASAKPKPRSEAENTRLVRNMVHAFIKALAARDLDAAVAMIQPDPTWNRDAIEKKMIEYHQEHSRLRTDPGARFPQFTKIGKEGATWTVEQVLVDPLERNDWMMAFRVEIPENPEATLSLALESIGKIG